MPDGLRNTVGQILINGRENGYLKGVSTRSDPSTCLKRTLPGFNLGTLHTFDVSSDISDKALLCAVIEDLLPQCAGLLEINYVGATNE